LTETTEGEAGTQLTRSPHPRRGGEPGCRTLTFAPSRVVRTTNVRLIGALSNPDALTSLLRLDRIRAKLLVEAAETSRVAAVLKPRNGAVQAAILDVLGAASDPRRPCRSMPWSSADWVALRETGFHGDVVSWVG
jgi:hypothetical protein